jgi:hypothetical protein
MAKKRHLCSWHEIIALTWFLFVSVQKEETNFQAYTMKLRLVDSIDAGTCQFGLPVI